MADGRIKTLRAILHPTAIKLAAGVVSVVGAYDIFSNQFSLPKLGRVAGMSGSLLPWWGWLIALLVVFVAALFEYVRRNVPVLAIAGGSFGFAESVPNTQAAEVRFHALETAVRGLANHDSKLAKTIEGQESRIQQKLGGIFGSIQALDARTAKIEGGLAFDPQLGNSLEQVLRNAEDARVAQIRRLEGDWERVGAKLNNSHLEAIHLLNFGINATTRSVLRGLLGRRPAANKMAPPTEKQERDELAGELQHWLQQVRNIAETAAYGAEIGRISRQAFYDGQQNVRQMDATERPSGIDPLAFADFYAVAYQCEDTAQYLSHVISELDEEDRRILERLRGFYETRTKR